MKLLNSLTECGISQLFISLVFLGSIPIPSDSVLKPGPARQVDPGPGRPGPGT